MATRTNMVARIEKVRYLTRPDYHIEVQYTVEGSDKVHRHIMSKSFKLGGRKDEIHQLYKRFDGEFKSMGDGCRAKILYDRHDSNRVLRFEIDTHIKGTLFLRRLPTDRAW